MSSAIAVIGPYSRPSAVSISWRDTTRSRRPLRGAAHIHVFDEAHFGADAPGVLDQRHQLIVVDAADDDGVDFEIRKVLARLVDAGEHVRSASKRVSA